MTRRALVAATLTTTGTMAAASASDTKTFWNRELSAKQAFDWNLPVQKEAKIVCVGDPKDQANQALYTLTTPEDTTTTTNEKEGIQVLQVGDTLESFDTERLKRENVNVLFVSYTPNARQIVAHLLQEIPSIEWIHARSAGIDFITGEQLSAWVSDNSRVVTNAKGTFSSTLAEYTLLACSYL